MNRMRIAVACVAAMLAISGCGHGRSDDTESMEDPDCTPGWPQFEVHPPEGWRQSLRQWPSCATGHEFGFTDMSYVSDREGSTSAVYVCIEKIGGRACSSRLEYMIKDGIRAGYRVTVALEQEAGGHIDSAAMRAWSDVQIDFAAKVGPVGPAVTDVPAYTLKGLARNGVEIEPVATTQRAVKKIDPRIDLVRAVKISRENFGLDTEAEADTATLAKVTLGQYGTELEKDPNKTSRIDPEIGDRLAWVVTFEGVLVQVHSPPGYSGPDSARQTVVTFVDPETGEFLSGLSF